MAEQDPSLLKFAAREELERFPMSFGMGIYVGIKYRVPNHGGYKRGTPLYHYTDAAGLLGILSSHRLWSTDIAYLNDPSEGRYLPETLLSRFERLAASDLEREFIRRLRDQTEDRRSYNVHSVSFCEHGDLLSQWRGYGSTGGGYAIEFSFDEGPDPQLGFLVPVQYGEERLDDISEDVFGIYASALRTGDCDLEDVVDQAAEFVTSLAPYFKNPTYAEEREFRIVSLHSSPKSQFKREMPIAFRARGGDVIPYLSLTWKLMKDEQEQPRHLPITKVVAGPGVDLERNRKAIEAALAHNGYTDVQVVRSSIPFRG